MKPLVRLHVDGPMLVSDLIDASSSSWRMDVLSMHFLPADVKEILQIPLVTQNCEDTWAWCFERKGVFTVKSCSCYLMLTATVQRRTDWLEGRPGHSNPGSDANGW